MIVLSNLIWILQFIYTKKKGCIVDQNLTCILTKLLICNTNLKYKEIIQLLENSFFCFNEGYHFKCSSDQ